MMDNPGYYAVIPATVRYDDFLAPNAKLLYGEITSLCNDSGFCYATNNYFADLYRVSKQSISKWINQLINRGYIFSKIEYADNSKEIKKRYLYINEVHTPIKEKFNTPSKKVDDPIKEKFKENNKNEYIKEIYKEKFSKPTLEEVKNYCIERNNKIDPQSFIDYYDSVGWKIGKNPMKNWKAAIRTWERNNNSKNQKRQQEVEYERI